MRRGKPGNLAGASWYPAATDASLSRSGTVIRSSPRRDTRCSTILKEADIMVPLPAISQPDLFDDDPNAFVADENFEAQGLANISYFDGFLTSLAIGPSVVPASKWLPILIETETGALDAEDAALLSTILVSQFGVLTEALHNAPETYEPFFWVDGDGKSVFSDWADGFFEATQFFRKHWSRLLEDEQNRDLILPILLQVDSDELRQILASSGIDLDEAAESSKGEIVESVLALHDYWSERTVVPLRCHKSRKVGRNAPCPCGSGKKYKKCCLH